jgi:maltooligosyltrehalose trehalohydrolase
MMTRFSVWAPEASRLRVRIDGKDHPMALDAGGWWRTNVDCAAHGTDYMYLLDDSDEPLPDPRSRWQPFGVHGPSRTYDHAAFPWTDEAWTGCDLSGRVIYSVRVGAFTPDGTFDAAIARLDHLADLGVDTVELHPVNIERGSGHHSACWYTPHPSYGGPDGLKRFVDACHERGIAVVLNLAYDHLQPGAGTHRIGPYLAEVANTWGHTLALDGPHGAGMRSFITDNVLMWLRDYHADGVRLDAAHTLIDRDAMLLLDELSTAVSALSISLGRPLALIAGSGLAGARFIPGPGADLVELLAPSPGGASGVPALDRDYRAEFGSLEQLFGILRAGFSTVLTTDRPTTALSPGLLRIGATLLLTAPSTPVLQMGEEWAARLPFTPDGLSTLGALDWSELDKAEHRDMLDLHRRLIALRKSQPDLAKPVLRRSEVWHGGSFLAIRRGTCVVVANLRRTTQRVNLHGTARSVLAATEPGLVLVHDAADLPGESAAVIACCRFDR